MGEKEWDGYQWVKDGRPYTYRVTWTDGQGQVHVTEFTDIDNGYDFYQSQGASAKWEHVDPYGTAE